MSPFNIPALNETGNGENVIIDKKPDDCPFCHRNISPQLFQAFRFGFEVQVIYRCPNEKCYSVFIAYYFKRNISEQFYKYHKSSIGQFQERIFSDDIIQISQVFVDIFNQASQSESLGMNYISGIGYRKALEFLIKDFLIKNQPDKEEEIKNKFLGNCIKEFITNPNLKDMAERAVWLGNDETHYSRKWSDKDINDLKMLIDATIHWIEMEMITIKYRESMK